MVSNSRRTFLATAGTVFIAGCSSDSGSSGPETIIDDTDTVNEDKYLTYTFRLNREGDLNLDVTVRRGPRLDIVTTSQAELREFEAGNRFKYNQELSFLDSPGGSAGATFPEGDYAVIVDNTNMIEAQPPTNLDDDNARVEILLTVE